MCSQNLLGLGSANLPHLRPHLILKQIGMAYRSSSEYPFPFVFLLCSSRVCLNCRLLKSYSNPFFSSRLKCVCISLKERDYHIFTLIWSCYTFCCLKTDALFCTPLHLFISGASRTAFSTW